MNKYIKKFYKALYKKINISRKTNLIDSLNVQENHSN